MHDLTRFVTSLAIQALLTITAYLSAAALWSAHGWASLPVLAVLVVVFAVPFAVACDSLTYAITGCRP